jgi:hypothetical protein
MTHTTGQILRATGLLIELLGVIGVMAQSRTSNVGRVSLPGVDSVSLGWLALVVGFTLWLVGRIMISVSSRVKRGSR